MAHSRIGLFAIDGRYIQDHFPGIGRYTYNLIDALTRVAPAERFVALVNPAQKNTRYDLGVFARYRNVEVRRVDASPRSMHEQFAIPRAVRARTSPAPTVLHSPYYVKPYLISPSVVTIFDLIPLRVPHAVTPLARWVFRFAVTLAVRTSTGIIVPSNATRDDLVTLQHGIGEKVTVIPLATDARFTPQSRAELARVHEKYALPARYALYVGINKPHKNLATLLDAWRAADVPDAALVIAGTWDARYERGNAGAREQARIALIHNVADVDLPALYSGATVFVMPSLYEGFGLPLLEAMACGAPAIASNAASLPEVGGAAALYFDPHDVNALADLLTRVLGNAALRDELRAKSLARAAEFSWERAAKETLAVYQKVSRLQNFKVWHQV